MAPDGRNRDSIPYPLGEINMTSLRILLAKLCGLFLKRKLDQEMDDEITAHLEMQIDDHLLGGFFEIPDGDM